MVHHVRLTLHQAPRFGSSTHWGYFLHLRLEPLRPFPARPGAQDDHLVSGANQSVGELAHVDRAALVAEDLHVHVAADVTDLHKVRSPPAL